MQTTKDILGAVDKDGFVVIKDFFSKELVDKAFHEIREWYEKDLSERTQNKVEQELYNSSAGTTILTPPMHLMLNTFAKSPTLDLMFEKILTDPVTSEFLKGLAGSNIKLRGYNIQYFTGVYDPKSTVGPAPSVHDWHRDSPGEMNISIPLTDFAPDNGATSFIRGSHKLPYSPRWNCLFGLPYNNYIGMKFFLKWNIFNRILAKKVLKEATGAYCEKGDIYFFVNDIWHGREPNLHGKRGMRLMVGAFPTDFPYPDKVNPPSDSILQKLPPNARKAASAALPENTEKDTLMHRIIKSQKPPGFLGLFYMARLERKVANVFSDYYYKVKQKRRFPRVISILKSILGE